MQTDLITKVYFNEHLTHSCVGMPQGLQALLSSYLTTFTLIYPYNIVIFIGTFMWPYISHLHICHYFGIFILDPHSMRIVPYLSLFYCIHPYLIIFTSFCSYTTFSHIYLILQYLPCLHHLTITCICHV